MAWSTVLVLSHCPGVTSGYDSVALSERRNLRRFGARVSSSSESSTPMVSRPIAGSEDELAVKKRGASSLLESPCLCSSANASEFERKDGVDSQDGENEGEKNDEDAAEEDGEDLEDEEDEEDEEVEEDEEDEEYGEIEGDAADTEDVGSGCGWKVNLKEEQGGRHADDEVFDAPRGDDISDLNKSPPNPKIA